MTLDRARELLLMQINMGGGYNRNAAKLILAEVERAHGTAAVDQLIRTLNLERVFEFKPGMRFARK